jgi:hypothetical protein
MLFLMLCFTVPLPSHAQQMPAGLRWGPAYEIPRTSSYILESDTILRIPNPPEIPQNLVAVWPGINTDANPSNLVQSCIMSSKTN